MVTSGVTKEFYVDAFTHLHKGFALVLCQEVPALPGGSAGPCPALPEKPPCLEAGFKRRRKFNSLFYYCVGKEICIYIYLSICPIQRTCENDDVLYASDKFIGSN